MNVEIIDNDPLKKDIVSLPFISAYTFRYYCDHGWMSRGQNWKYIDQLPNGIIPEKVKNGQVIYLTSDLLERFFEEIDPKINARYKLICGLKERIIDDLFSGKISKKIIHWYTPHNMSEHPLITTIPIGFQNLHWRIDNHPQSDIRNIIKIADEDISVEKNILMSFRIKTNPKNRQPCFDYFDGLGDLVTQRQNFEVKRTDREFILDFFREIRRHKFVVCPFGNVFDCHRNWETFALGGIPIIKKHKCLEAFYDMPAWFVDDWSDVTKKSMDEKYEIMKSNWNSYNHAKVYFKYWYNLIFDSN